MFSFDRLIGVLGAALVIAFLFITLSQPTPAVAPESSPTEEIASSTSPERNEAETENEVEAKEPANETAVTEQKPEPVKLPTPVPTTPVVVPPVTTPPASAPTSTTPLSVNDRVRASLVNIICSTATGGVGSISASGVVIDPKGVVLTNAHVAQYFLLEQSGRFATLDCLIRVGSPAYPRYEAELLFLPPAWISANAEKIDDETPTGNGEHDYALLRITKPIGTNTLPESFAYLPLLPVEMVQGTDVLIAGYPAGFLGGITIAKELYAASSPSRVGQVFTYEGTTIDLFSIGGTVVAQQGSSGGPVADNFGNTVGLIVTSTQAEETSQRDLRAISMEYLFRDFAREKGQALSDFLNKDLVLEAQIFKIGVAPNLTQSLLNVLDR